MTEEPTSDKEQDGEPPPFLRWPPPGLERMQGDLWRVAARGALGGGLLVLPLLFVTARSEEFASLGPFADAWWVTLVLATIGLGFAIDALASTGRLLVRVSRALERGYDWQTVGFVLADLRRDMGFLLQGGRHFAVLDLRERRAIAGLRVIAVCFHTAAGLWLPVVLAIGLLLGARGVIGPDALWMITVLPAALFYLFGGVAGASEDSRVRRARRVWYSQPWASDLVTDEIASWRVDLATYYEGATPGSGGVSGAPLLRRLAVVAGALAVLVAVPVLTLVPTSAIGPVLAMVGIPSFGQAQVRAAKAEAFRPYAVEPDDAISPQEAGRLLHDLVFVGSDRLPSRGELPPSGRVEVPWVPESQQENPVGAEPHGWSEVVFGRVTEEPTAELVAYLAEIARHPAHRDFSRLAHAGELDAASSRWQDPLPEGMTMADVPFPQLSGLRTGAFAHIGAAAHELAQGDAERAEEMVREVISVGLLLGDDGPTLIENVIGYTIARSGGDALEAFYDATGRDEEAEQLRSLAAVADQAAERIHTRPPQGIEAFVRSMPPMVTDTTAMRGLRWEYFALTTTLTPCLNLHRMVFGPELDYQRFLEEARSALVRWPSEEGLFALARGGYLGATPRERGDLIGRLLAVSMTSGEGACGEVVRHLKALEDLI